MMTIMRRRQMTSKKLKRMRRLGRMKWRRRVVTWSTAWERLLSALASVACWVLGGGGGGEEVTRGGEMGRRGGS